MVKYACILLLNLGFILSQDTTASVSREAWIQEARKMIGETQTDSATEIEFTTTDKPKQAPIPDSRDTVITGSIRSSRELKIFGDHTIPSGAVYRTDIRIIGGDLTIDGRLESHATVIGGNVVINPEAVVNGDILVLGGQVERSKEAVIRGKIIETNLTEGLVYRETGAESDSLRDWDLNFPYDGEYSCPDEKGRRQPINWIHPQADLLVYNRNEGFVITPVNTQWDRRGASSFILNLSAGYRQADHSLVGRVTFQKTFFKNRNLLFFAGVMNQSRSDDTYRLSADENTVAGIFGRQDFLDRWNEQGWRAGFGVALGGLRTSFSINSVQTDTLGVVDMWSLFNRRRLLRPGLLFTPSTANYALISADFKTNHYQLLGSGIAAHLEAEIFRDGFSLQDMLNSNLNTMNTRIFLTAVANWEFTPGIMMRTRLLAGMTSGTLPEYRYFGVGGIGSLGAHAYKEELGDEMIQGSVALIFKPEFLDSNKFLSLYLETGHAWQDLNQDYTQLDVTAYAGQMLKTAGIAVGKADGNDVDFLVNVAKSLDTPATYETTFRLTLNF